MAEKKKKSLISHGVAAQNRKARHDYTINDTIEAGLALVGPEVKSLRAGRATLVDAWAGEREGEMWLFNAYIPEWQAGSFVARFEPRRPRKLLLHQREIGKFAGKASERGFTLVPLRLYFKRGKAKVELAVARGKQLHDKRQAAKKAEAQKDIRKAMKDRR